MSRKQFTVVLACTVLFSLIGGALSVELFHSAPLKADQGLFSSPRQFKLPDGHFIGVVEKGKFQVLEPRRPLSIPIRLTRIQMQEARPVESAEIDLRQYEGKAILVTGHDGGSWIYRAEVVDRGGPLLTLLVKKAFPLPIF
jgi:hypothetical protein